MAAKMRFDIPENYYIRWQAALAVLEDLQEDKKTPFTMDTWGDKNTKWEGHCGTAACFGGYITVAPYCIALGAPEYGAYAKKWLTPSPFFGSGKSLYQLLFNSEIDAGSRAKTLAFLKTRLKRIFKDSTGKTLKAPLIFYVD